MVRWLAQFPPNIQTIIRELSVPKRDPIPRKERRQAERAARKARKISA